MASKPAKTTKKPVAKSLKTNTAKPSVLNKKLNFNWKYVAVIGIVLAALIGFLYVRLSKAATEVPCTGPNMSTNCYYMPDKALGHDGGQMLGKTDGTVSWAGTSGTSITFSDRLYGGVYLQYCFYIQISAEGTTQWRIDWKNTSAGTASNRTGSDGKTGTQTVRCIGPAQVNGSAYNLQNQEVKFTVVSGGAVVYKMVRAWSGAPVTQPAPGTKITAPSTQPVTNTTNQCSSQVFGQGSQGGCVTLIQQRLKDLGYGISAVDGIYGSNTASAVKAFQARSGLTQDGVVGPQTWSALTSPNAARKS